MPRLGEQGVSCLLRHGDQLSVPSRPISSSAFSPTSQVNAS